MPVRFNIHGVLQDAVVATINDPNYSFSLPRLSDWESVVSSSPDEKERLEFVGDAVMHLSVALYLYRLFPNAAPGLYTNIRSAVNTNATFTHLMVKAGAYELPSHSHSTKAAADSFEVIVAALYFERGFADVCAWVQEQYAPLIAAARESYDKCFTRPTYNSRFPFLSSRRCRSTLDPASTPLLKKIRLSRARNSPRSTLMAQRVINRMRSKGKVKLCFPTRKSKLPLERRLHSSELLTPEPQRPRSVIDLTMDSESSEVVGPSNPTQPPQPNIKPLDVSQAWCHPSESDATPQSGQAADVDWSPSGRSQPTPESIPSSFTPSSSHTVPRATFQYFARSIQPPSDNIPSGTYGDPIVIEDSEPED